MSHFYGIVEGSAKTKATRRGFAAKGLKTIAASWAGAIEVELRHHNGIDEFRVVERPWHGRGANAVIVNWQPFRIT